MATPVSDDIDAVGTEDGIIFVTLRAYDQDDGDSTPPIFRLDDLPANGTLTDYLGNPVTVGADYVADYLDPDTGLWTVVLYFTPDLDWSGVTDFHYVAVDSDSEVSAPSTATITADPVADAPLIDVNINDQPDVLGPAENVTGTSSQENGPIVTALDGGRTLVVWQQGLFPGSVSARIYDASGAPEGAAFAVTASGGVNEIQPSAAGRPDGGFAIAWVVDGGSTGGGDIVTAFYDAGTTTPALVVSTAASTTGREADPTVTAVGDGFVVTWAVENAGAADIYAQRYEADGTTDGGPFLVMTGADPGFNSGSSFDPPAHHVAAVGDDGAFVVAAQSGGMIVATRVDETDTPGPQTPANSSGGTLPAVTGLANGDFVVVWQQDDGSGSEELHVTLFHWDGTAAVLDFTPLNLASSAEFSVDVAGLPDGRFVLAWIGNNGVDGTNDIFTQVFSGNGTPAAGGAVNVSNTGMNGSGQPIQDAQPTITVNDDGTFTVGWLQLRASGGTDQDIFIRHFDPTPEFIHVRAGDTVELPTTITLADQDGSEMLNLVTIGQLPENFTLSAGHRADSGDPTSAWVIDRSDPGDAAFLDALAAGTAHLTITTAADYSGGLQLELNASSVEIGDPTAIEGSSTYTILLNVAPGVDAVDDVLAAAEDTPITFAAADILGNDGVASNETLVIDSVSAWSGGSAVLNADGSVTFTPDADFSGDAHFDYVTRNGAGLTDTATVTVAVASVNDAPVLDLDIFEAGNDAVATYYEGDPLAGLAPFATLTDDNTSYDGATLTVTISNNGTADDQLTVNDVGAGPGEIGVSGLTLSYEGTIVGTLNGGTNGGPLIVVFNADACGCAVQATMQNIAFFTSSDTPTTDQRTLDFSLVDGGGTDLGGFDTGSAQLVLDVVAINDAPTATAPLTDYAATEQVALDIKNSGLSVADPDAGTGEVTVTLGVDYGVLHVEAGGTSVVITDNDSWQVTLTGTIDEINALLNSDASSVVTYTADDDFPPSSATLMLDIHDGGNSGDGGEQSGGATANIVITAINDAPQLDLDYFASGNNAVATFTEGDGPVYLAFDAVFDDDNEDWDGATMTISIAGATAGDQLTIEDVGTGPGELGVDGSNITYEGDVVGTWSGGVNGAPLVVTFNADACACAIELLAASILYENIDDLSAASTRDVTFSFVDGAETASATVALDVLPYAEILTGPDVTGDEDVAIALTGIVVDGVAADPATSLVTVTLEVAHGTLDIRTDVAGGIDASAITGGADGSNTITLTATQDQINATLAAANGLTYLGDQDYNGPDELDISAIAVNSGAPISFTPFPSLPVGTPPTALGFADLDGDSAAEIVIGVEGGIIVFGSTFSGGFGIPDGSPRAFAFGDFDGDGVTDIAFSSEGAGSGGYVGYVSSITGDTETIAAVPYAFDLVAADLDGDGLTDLVVTDADNGRVGVMLQSAPGVFQPPAYSTTTSQFIASVAVGDVNGDGFLDLLAGSAGTLPGMTPPGAIDLLLGNGDGTFGSATQILSGASHITDLMLGDFNGDGALDIAFSSIADPSDPSSISGVQVALGNGDGSFAAAVGYTTTSDGTPAQIVAADLNGDGFIDLVVTNGNDPGTISILAGNGDGTFQAPVDLGSDGIPVGIALGDPDADGDLDIIVANMLDGTLSAFNNNSIGGPGGSGVSAIVGITVDPVDDAGVATDDTGFTLFENATVIVDVLANDTDVDSPAPVLATVNGATLVNPGDFTTLASGARVSLNADGTLTYDPHGAFNSLIDLATATATGAVNTSAIDSFSYTLDGGDTGTVSVTINGVSSADDQLAGDTGANVLLGRSTADLYMLQHGGTDSASGGGGNDGFYFGAALDSTDNVDGGAGTDDQVGLQGDYTGPNALTFGANNLVGIETLVIFSGNTTSFGDTSGSQYSYDLTTIDANVEAGKTLTVNANLLQAGENLTFNGAAETDGSFLIYGGQGHDDLTGGQGSDAFFFGDDGRFTAADQVDGQGGLDDQLGLRGDYSGGVTFLATTMTNIETLVLISATDARFAAPGTAFDYDITLDDANVGAGKVLTISANALKAGEDVAFDGSAETDGSFRFMMGAGNDSMTGGANADQFWGRLGQDVMTGGGGNDTFYFRAITESTTGAMDQITDFNAGDHIDLSVIDASTAAGGNDAFSYIGGSAFNHVAGELRVSGSGTSWTVEGDVDGDGIADFAIAVTTLGAYSFTGSDFVL